MLTKYETEMVQRAMKDELEGRQTAVYKCAAGIVLVVVLALVGPVVGLNAKAAPDAVASAGVLERLAGIAN